MSDIKYIYEKEQNRIAAYDGSKCAGVCEYTAPGNFWIITHTIVDPTYGGQGIARALVDTLMGEAVRAGVKVKPFCSYAAGVFQKNPGFVLEDGAVSLSPEELGLQSRPN